MVALFARHSFSSFSILCDQPNFPCSIWYLALLNINYYYLHRNIFHWQVYEYQYVWSSVYISIYDTIWSKYVHTYDFVVTFVYQSTFISFCFSILSICFHHLWIFIAHLPYTHSEREIERAREQQQYIYNIANNSSWRCVVVVGWCCCLMLRLWHTASC